MDDAGASAEDQYIVLSRDLSAWTSEHLFSVSKAVPEEEMTPLTGDFVTKVFEGAFKQVRGWHEEMLELARQRNPKASDVYFFYTTCPKCAAAYGKNYVVGVAKIS
ncbi:hydrolase [Mesorhizobium sp. ORM8.1]